MATKTSHPSLPNAAIAPTADRRRLLLAIATIWLLTLVAYHQAMRNGYIWDDDAHVTQNFLLQNTSGLYKIWFNTWATPQYYPIVHSSFWIEYQLWGLNPIGYHVVNILFHAANATLVFLLLRRLRVPGGDVAAWLAGIFFALHPIQVESVAWITERKNVLSGLFYLLSLFMAARVWALEQNQGPRTFDRRIYGWCIVFFIAALLSKSVTASLPAAILLLVWWRHGRITWRDFLWSLPLFAIGIAAGLNTAYLERVHVGAVGSTWDLTFLQRALVAGRAACSYAKHILWPDPLMFFYPKWNVDPRQWWQYLFPLGVLALIALLSFLRKKISRGPLVAVLFFLGTLFPALGFLNVFPFRYSFVADHFQYLASLGIMVMAASLIALLVQFLAARFRQHELFAWCVPSAIILTLAIITWRECYKFHDDLTLFTDTIEKNSTSAIAYNNLGIYYQRGGDLDEAEKCYRVAFEKDHTLYEACANTGAVYLRRALLEQKDMVRRRACLASAEAYFRRSLGLEPEYVNGLLGLGVTLLEEERVPEANAVLSRAADLAPGRPDVLYSCARALSSLDSDSAVSAAIIVYQQVLVLTPKDPLTHYALGRLYCRQNRFAQGAAEIEKALRFKPNWPEAERTLKFARALQLDPSLTRPATNP